MCGKELPATGEYFASRYDRKKPVFQSNCRPCQKKYRRKHYELNRDKYIKKAHLQKIKITTWFNEIKKSLSCSICGEERPWTLDFHHTDSELKDFPVSVLVSRGCKNKIIREMEKCVVLCSNCHRDYHFKEKQAGELYSV